MSKIKGLNLEDIFNRSPITRLQSSRGLSEIEEKFIRNALSDDVFFKRVSNIYGEEGIKDFIKMIKLKKTQDIDQEQIVWLYTLNNAALQKRKSIKRGASFDSSNPQQNQLPFFRKGRGNALILYKKSFHNLVQRHETRELNQKIALFSKLPIFADISHSQLSSICQKVTQQKYEKGNIIYNQGGLANKLYIVKQGTFIMKRYNQSHKKCKSVLLLDNFNIFGEECLEYSIYSQKQSKYLCQVSCKSNEGVLFVIDRSVFGKQSRGQRNIDQNISTNIYQMYKQRRIIAEGKQFQDESNDMAHMESGDTLKKYYERLYKLKRRNPTKFVQEKQDLYTDIQFIKKDEFLSMKLKLKYQNILDKVKTMNSVTLKKIQINTKNQPKNFTKGIIDIQKKFILKELQKKYHDRSLRNHSKMVMNALKIQAEEDDQYPKHKSEYLRNKPNRNYLYNSQITKDISKLSPPQLSQDVQNSRQDFNIFNFTSKNTKIVRERDSFSFRT